jgi:hypothetical protein
VPRRKARYPVGVAAVLGVLAVMACDSDTDDNQFREDVISCEEAVAHLEECCSEFRPTNVQCRYFFRRTEGCIGPDTTTRVEPDLDLRESRCIRDLTCDGIQSRGLCTNGQVSPDGGVSRPFCQ